MKTVLYFATKNKFKLKEAEQILKTEIKSIKTTTNEIQDIEVENVIKYKVYDTYMNIKKPVIAEDTGLYFNALNGFPGALIKWLMKSVGTDGDLKNGSNNQRIIDLLSKFKDKTAYAKTTIGLCYCDDFTKIITVKGIIKGRVADKPMGTNGFGFDDFFIPERYEHTFAQMTSEKKNEISMRKIAFSNLKKILDDNPNILF